MARQWWPCLQQHVLRSCKLISERYRFFATVTFAVCGPLSIAPRS